MAELSARESKVPVGPFAGKAGSGGNPGLFGCPQGEQVVEKQEKEQGRRELLETSKVEGTMG